MSPVDLGNIPCPYFCHSHIDFKIAQCHLLTLRNTPSCVANIFLVSIGFMSPVDFKKWPCCPVEIKDPGPYFRKETGSI